MSDRSPEEPVATVTVGRLAAIAAIVVLLPVAIAAGVVIGASSTDGSAGSAAGEHGPAVVAPLDLASVSPAIAEHYRFAAAHEAELRQVPCFCGCEEFLGHRDLYDCFVRADGAGWDAHAAGCGVCIGEAITSRELLDAGRSPTEVRDAVVEQFGTTPTTTPPS
jgi:hypothetical protein